MSAGNAASLVFLLAALAAFYWFIFRGRKYGYQAIASRTSELLGQGVNHAWLLYSAKGVGFDASLRQTSVWTLLNTGFLAYVSGANLIIEFPWWNTMRPLLTVPISQLNPTRTTALYARKFYPAVRIVGRSYVVIGDNLQDVPGITNQLKMGNPAENETLLEAFVHSLIPSSVIADSRADSLQSNSAPTTASGPSLVKIIGGTFWYVILPCLLITAALIAWAIFTKQPAFR